VVLDCANGAGYKVGPTVMAELGAEVVALGVEPNGRNINEGCGCVHPQRAMARVREVRADLGIAIDGDADRVMLIDERGRLVDGDQLLAVAARDLAERGLLAGGAVVATVMSNLGLEKALSAIDVGLVRTQVGDRYVLEAMRVGGYNLGGEQSGHLIFLDHNTTGDGLLTALQILAIMRRTGRPLSELVQGIERFPQVLINVQVAEQRPLEGLPRFQERLRGVETELGERGRVVVRYSGTEPKARIMVEGADEDRVRELAQDLARTLERELGT
jgi:phosphoglucosamine mutase